MEETQQEYPELPEDQFQILDKERELHLAGKTKSYTREEANAIIRGKNTDNDLT